VGLHLGCQPSTPGLEAVIRNAKRTGLCSNDLPTIDMLPTITELADRADDKLFEKVLDNPYHILCYILPNNLQYHLMDSGGGVIIENL